MVSRTKYFLIGIEKFSQYLWFNSTWRKGDLTIIRLWNLWRSENILAARKWGTPTLKTKEKLKMKKKKSDVESMKENEWLATLKKKREQDDLVVWMTDMVIHIRGPANTVNVVDTVRHMFKEPSTATCLYVWYCSPTWTSPIFISSQWQRWV